MKLTEFYKKAGLTAAEFSRRTGISESKLSRLKSGQDPDVPTMRLIKKHTKGKVRPEDWL